MTLLLSRIAVLAVAGILFSGAHAACGGNDDAPTMPETKQERGNQDDQDGRDDRDD